MLLDVVRIAAPLIVGYLVGGIPFSLIVGRRFYGIDPREHGSGNLGATNVFRVLGVKAGLIVAVLDVAKGALAVALAMLVCPPSVTGNLRDAVLVGSAMAAIAGHTFSPYIRFKGGKGVATAAGAIAVAMPLTWPLLFVTFVLVIALSRMVSLASLTVAVEFVILSLLLYGDRPVLLFFAIIAAALVIARHWSNIGRIYRGEERKISLRRRDEAPDDTEE